MELQNEQASDGTQVVSTGAQVVELARKVRLAQRTAAVFMRRWAVEQAVEEVGLVALRMGSIDLPLSPAFDDEGHLAADPDSLR